MRVARATRRRCGWAHGVEEPEGIAAHYVEGAGASTHSHSEWIVGRSRAFMDHPGYSEPLVEGASVVRGSGVKAILKARPKALKMVSAW